MMVVGGRVAIETPIVLDWEYIPGMAKQGQIYSQTRTSNTSEAGPDLS